MKNKKKKKVLIPALAVTILAGGGFTNCKMLPAPHRQAPQTEVAEENDAQNRAELAKQAKITEEEAIKAALEKVPGTMNEVELEDEEGTIVYGIELVSTDGTEQEVKVDAQTGKICKSGSR